MATTQATLTPASDTAPAVIEIPARDLSGPQWVPRFPGSADLAELIEPFRTSASNFLAAIAAAGGGARISATYRPPERAYLMHYSSMLARREIAAKDIPAMTGVNIEWVHPTNAASIAAAAAMRDGYGIVFPPALVSNHTRRTAIDITITNIVGKTIKDAAGNEIRIDKLVDLNPVGKSFGVIKLASDPPHWSIDGH